MLYTCWSISSQLRIFYPAIRRVKVYGSKPKQENPVRRMPRKRIVLSSSGTIRGCCGRTSGRSTEDPHLLQGIVETLHMARTLR